ncbi:MAG: 16S rRNA (cytosine(1402)-N(4))-methyltransferase RsmH, partial [Calditrichaeota bacterium]
SGIYLDGTAGGGGHAQAIVQELDAKGRLVALDLDEEAVNHVRRRLQQFGQQVIVEQANFKDFPQVLTGLHIESVSGILLDLGVSSYQIDQADRGFSFSRSGDLDMRMSRSGEVTAYHIVNTYSLEELENVFRTYGEERRARAVARAIVRQRDVRPLQTTVELKEVVSRVLPAQHQVKSLARIFQALRIAVNQELNNLRETLAVSLEWLAQGGRIVVIAYHSLEDRIVKTFFKTQAAGCECPPDFPVCVCGKKARVRILTRRPVRPKEQEIKRNPRSRSAKLRAAEKIS